MYTGRFNMFHDAHDVNVFAITNRIDLGFFGTLQELVNQYFVVRHVFENTQHMTLQVMIIDHDLHTLTSQYIGWTYQHRIIHFMGNAQSIINIMRYTIPRVRYL